MIKSSLPLMLATTPASAGHGTSLADTSTPIDLNFILTNGQPGFCVFTVTGASAVPNILPGALVVCNTRVVPQNCDTVVVEHNGGVCVKILELKPKLRLISQNKEYEPREVEENDSFVVLGVVVASINFFRRSERTIRMTG